MSELTSYIQSHAKQCLPSEGADVIFFTVKETPEASAAGLLAAIASHTSQGGALDLFDGKEHGYIELGAWLGSQGLGLALIGLGARLGLWQLLTPRTVLGSDTPDALVQQMAGAGMVTLLAQKPVPMAKNPPTRGHPGLA